MSRKSDLEKIAGKLRVRRSNLTFQYYSRLHEGVSVNQDDNVLDDTEWMEEVELNELERVNSALELVRIGKFGVCKDCGREIPIARLEALPYAVRCIQCQRNWEKQSFPQPT